jgi:hypothetical protein
LSRRKREYVNSVEYGELGFAAWMQDLGERLEMAEDALRGNDTVIHQYRKGMFAVLSNTTLYSVDTTRAKVLGIEKLLDFDRCTSWDFVPFGYTAAGMVERQEWLQFVTRRFV